MRRYDCPSKWNKSVASFVQGRIGTSWPNVEHWSDFLFDLEYFRHS